MGVSCHLCEASMDDALYVYDRGRTGPLLTMACRSCSLVQTMPHASAEEVAMYYASGEYRREFPDLPRMWIDEDGEPHADIIIAPDDERYRLTCDRHGAHAAKRLVAGLRIEPGQRVLEVGSGDGSVAGAMHELLGGGVAVLERDARKAAEAVARGVPVHDDSLDPEGLFDVAFALQVVEHFADPVADLARVVRQVRVGGSVYVEVPCVERPYVSLAHFLQRPHTVNFSRHTLAALLHRAGLDDVHTDYDGAVLCGYGVRGESGSRAYEPHGGPMAEEVVGKLLAWERERAETAEAVRMAEAFDSAEWRASVTEDEGHRAILEHSADELRRWRTMATSAAAQIQTIVKAIEASFETRPSWDRDMWTRGLRAGQSQEAQRIATALGHVLNGMMYSLNRKADDKPAA